MESNSAHQRACIEIKVGLYPGDARRAPLLSRSTLTATSCVYAEKNVLFPVDQIRSARLWQQ
jgi:hypothetical protein